MDDKKILERVKMKIAIYNSEQDNIVFENKDNKIMKSIGIAAGILLSTTVIAATGVVLTEKNMNRFGNNASQGVGTAVDNNYVQMVNNEYQTADGIDVKVDSFLIDDSNFDIVFDIKFSDKYNANDMLGLYLCDLKVIDENGKKVFATMEAEAEEEHIDELRKDKENSKNNYKLYFGGYGNENKIINEHEIKNYVTATGNPVNFPKSKKLIVTFSRIVVRKFVNEPNRNDIYKGQWRFELDVPEKMYNRELSYYKIKDSSDVDYILDKAQLSNTAFKIYLKNVNDLAIGGKEYVETSDGKKFYPAMRNDGDGLLSVDSDGNTEWYNTFNLTKFDATDCLKLHLFKNSGQEVVIELEKMN